MKMIWLREGQRGKVDGSSYILVSHMNSVVLVINKEKEKSRKILTFLH